MPELGEIKYGASLVYKSKTRQHIWQACRVCGKQRWVQLENIKRGGNPRDTRCAECARKSLRKNDSKPDGRGYKLVWLFPNDFFYPMATTLHSANGGYVGEHRLVVAKSLGRCLQSWELVHHINGDKSDNSTNNLQIVMQGQHRQITLLENRIKLLEKRVMLLEPENVVLKLELSQTGRVS